VNTQLTWQTRAGREGLRKSRPPEGRARCGDDAALPSRNGVALVADAVTYGDTLRDCIEMARFLACQCAERLHSSCQRSRLKPRPASLRRFKLQLAHSLCTFASLALAVGFPQAAGVSQ
jgi:hypothetical protein